MVSQSRKRKGSRLGRYMCVFVCMLHGRILWRISIAPHEKKKFTRRKDALKRLYIFVSISSSPFSHLALIQLFFYADVNTHIYLQFFYLFRFHSATDNTHTHTFRCAKHVHGCFRWDLHCPMVRCLVKCGEYIDLQPNRNKIPRYVEKKEEV